MSKGHNISSSAIRAIIVVVFFIVIIISLIFIVKHFSKSSGNFAKLSIREVKKKSCKGPNTKNTLENSQLNLPD